MNDEVVQLKQIKEKLECLLDNWPTETKHNFLSPFPFQVPVAEDTKDAIENIVLDLEDVRS